MSSTVAQLVAGIDTVKEQVLSLFLPSYCNRMVFSSAGMAEYLFQEKIKIGFSIAIAVLFAASHFLSSLEKRKLGLVDYSPSMFAFLIFQVILPFRHFLNNMPQDQLNNYAVSEGIYLFLTLCTYATLFFFVLSFVAELSLGVIFKNMCLFAFLYLLDWYAFFVQLGGYAADDLEGLLLNGVSTLLMFFVLLLIFKGVGRLARINQRSQ